MNQTIRTMVELEVNKELAAALREELEDQLAGMYDRWDKLATKQMIDEVDHKSPADWSAGLKKELVMFVCCTRKGSFQCGEGYVPTCWMSTDKDEADLLSPKINPESVAVSPKKETADNQKMKL